MVIITTKLFTQALEFATKLGQISARRVPRRTFMDTRLFKTPGQGDYITPDFEFGLPQFGCDAYDIEGVDNVPLDEEGRPLWVDWSLVRGAIPPPYNQRGLGICYICAPLSGISAVNFLHTRESVVLSLQHVMDCSPRTVGDEDEDENGLWGGDSRKVLDFAVSNGGLLPEALYPFTGVKGLCQKIEGQGVYIDEWLRVKPGCELSLKYALAHLPVIVEVYFGDVFTVNGEAIRVDVYKNGVIQGPTLKPNHNLLLLGYGEPAIPLPKHAWRGINSWGRYWGENGKCWIEMGTGEGQELGALGVLRCPIVPLKWTKDNPMVKSCRGWES